MNEAEVISWTALEFEEREKSKDWFWALGIAVCASAVTALIYGNYFFAALIILSGLLLGFFAVKKPDVIVYELNKKGVRIDNRLYSYDTIKSFWVETEPHTILFIKTQRIFMPIISIPIENISPLAIKEAMLLEDVPEEEMHENPALRIMEVFGF